MNLTQSFVKLFIYFSRDPKKNLMFRFLALESGKIFKLIKNKILFICKKELCDKSLRIEKTHERIDKSSRKINYFILFGAELKKIKLKHNLNE
jgi:hypothetical protein